MSDSVIVMQQHYGTHTALSTYPNESGLGDPHVVHVKLAGSWRHHLHAGLCNQLGKWPFTAQLLWRDGSLHTFGEPGVQRRWRKHRKHKIFRTWLLTIGHHWRYLHFDMGTSAMAKDTKKETWQDTARCSSSHRPTKPLDPRIQVPNGCPKFNYLCRWSVVYYDPHAINCDYN